MDENIKADFWKGQLLELLGSTNESYFTQIIEQNPDLVVQRPKNRKNIPMVIDTNKRVTVYFHDDLNNLYAFESRVQQFENGKTLIDKPSVGSIKLAQRRRFFRVQVAVEIRLLLNVENTNETEELTVFTHDISGGGLSFLQPHKVVEEESEVKGKVYLKTKSDEEQIIEFISKVVRVVKQGKEMYQTSLQFIEMNEAVRADIVRFCIDKQIELRNKVIGNLLV